MVDRYTKAVLTLIAFALVYLCVIVTPLPRAHAQTPSIRPGEPSGPTEVVIVGWQSRDGAAAFPVSIGHPLQVTASQPLPIRGEVTTERSSSRLADRVVLIGWEEDASREKMTALEPLSDDNFRKGSRALPVKTTQ
jgi:hypothetical protein